MVNKSQTCIITVFYFYHYQFDVTFYVNEPKFCTCKKGITHINDNVYMYMYNLYHELLKTSLFCIQVNTCEY